MPGGQVATAMTGVARLGLRAGYLGVVGDDDAGRRVLAPLEEAGVDLSQVKRVAGAATQLAMILIDGNSGERTLVWYRDPKLRLEPGEVDPAWVASARALHLDTGHPEAAIAAARAAGEAGLPVVLDADAAQPSLEPLWPLVDFPIVSQSFAEGSSGDVSVSAALDALVRGGARMAVVTLGEEGAVARVGDRLIRSPGFEVAARDTTGAGDAFRAGFLAGLLEGRDAEGVLACAHGVAALNCTGLGAQGGLPDRASLEAFLAERRPRAWREPAGVRI